MKVLFVSGREPAYVRNSMLLKGLRSIGAEIVDCTDSSASYPRRFFNVLRRFFFLRNHDFDCVFVGFFGQPLVPIIKSLTSKPIIFDAFLSAYDTMCFDRKRFAPDSIPGRFFYWLDKASCEQADLVLLDTEAYVDYFVHTFGLKREKLRALPVGADDSLFHPRETGRGDGRFRVFYYSSFLPLHGASCIVEAASLLMGEPEIEFVVVGRGPEKKRVLDLAREMGVGNLTFVDWLPYRELPQQIAAADLCLGGHFSDIEKAKRVIAGKTYQFLAMRKPVVVGDCPGNRELLTDRESALFVAMADPGALAAGILELKADASLRERIAEGGYRVFRERGSVEAIGAALKRALGW